MACAISGIASRAAARRVTGAADIPPATAWAEPVNLPSSVQKPVDDLLPAMLALDWIERDPVARLICSDELIIAWTNPAARAALARGGDLEQRDGHLATCDRAQQNELCAFAKGCDQVLATLVLPRHGDDGYLLMRGRRIGPGDGHIGLTFFTTGPDFRALHADLERAFGLTPAEHRVLLRMIEGLNADAIADAMDLSIETVRSHIRNLYTKMGVASREAMFARVAPFRL